MDHFLPFTHSIKQTKLSKIVQIMPNKSFKISRYQVTPSEFSIQINGGEKKSLQPKFIEVLLYLAKNYGRVVPRDELIDHIWGQDSFVGEKSLTNAIWHLRKTLTNVEGEDEIIKTIRKAGYQLMIKPQWPTISSTVNKVSSPKLVESTINYSVDSAIENSMTSSVYQEQGTYKKQDSINVAQNSPNSNKSKIINSTTVLIALIISLLVLLFIQQLPSDEGPKVTAITKHPGSELFPAPSPDGRFLVYSQVLTNQPTNLFMKDTHQAEF